MKERPPLSLRAARRDDRNFILSTWVRGVKNSSPKSADSHWVCSAQHAMIEQLICTPGVEVIVANIDGATDDFIAGYAVVDRKRSELHWLYVRDGEWRRQGIAKQLICEAFGFEPEIFSTYCNRDFREFLTNTGLRARHDSRRLTAALRRLRQVSEGNV